MTNPVVQVVHGDEQHVWPLNRRVSEDGLRGGSQNHNGEDKYTQAHHKRIMLVVRVRATFERSHKLLACLLAGRRF